MIRSASRTLVRELGFMNRNLAESDLSASGVHALLEIEQGRCVTAKQLCESLLLEKSTVSRLVRKLVGRGEISEVEAPYDGRAKVLQLTDRGRKTLIDIHRHATNRVIGALDPLETRGRRTIIDGLTAYADALQRARLDGKNRDADWACDIIAGYQPGLVGHISKMHSLAYHELEGFGASFEAKVAAGLAEFTTRLANPKNQVWTAQSAGHVLGSIAIDGESLGENTAHLRWFLVDRAGRGSGIGKRLLDAALEHCDLHDFDAIRLWTFKGLDAARHLYERNGFILEQEYSGNQWGTQVTEQIFVQRR
ncbi:bifunctional helix-turn-helix transcriptional regulator/GNAT family N-acetyltransferase [Hoeflea poritis]|uniref:Helix-turn-helix domain-containing GNAT family N-acetyltransferase n=1 Tax=Hoeflea poritis TaxID=2993659 RepID=A0ABT4VHH1_9HYPH|nr:helix-turn-helix domain-containing GNAT family N-acetyltransferase [Hoeflea poritis]MDA4844145.1 helix-turn-helix domain-containing GNAT family N-acetyltransferase [Hoeflea poritis]